MKKQECWDVFVYGTLRRGFYNHGYLRDCPCLGQAVTAEPYTMYVTGGVPSLMADEPRYTVVGEVYRVDAATLARLDALEEHPSLYCRSLADIVLEDGHTQQAWVYFARQPLGVLSGEGDFACVSTS